MPSQLIASVLASMLSVNTTTDTSVTCLSTEDVVQILIGLFNNLQVVTTIDYNTGRWESHITLTIGS
jgi:hypothetical protein